MPQLRRRFGDTPYLEFGWGDRRYYQTESSALSAKLLAVLLPSDSTMHVVAVAENPESYYTDEPLVSIELETSSYVDLVKFISNSFYKNRQMEILEQANGRSGDSQFYKARGLYHLFNTCNKWTAKGLRESGLDMTPGLKLTADSVMDGVIRVAKSKSVN